LSLKIAKVQTLVTNIVTGWRLNTTILLSLSPTLTRVNLRLIANNLSRFFNGHFCLIHHVKLSTTNLTKEAFRRKKCVFGNDTNQMEREQVLRST